MNLDASRIMYETSKKTWKFRKNLIGEVSSSFSSIQSPRSIDLSDVSNLKFGMNVKSLGVKTEFAERLNKHNFLAYDLIANLVDDVVSLGAEPINLTTSLSFKKINLTVLRQLTKGLLEASQTAQISVVDNDVAEFPDRVNGFSDYSYNWNATLSWVVNTEKIIDGKSITPGQSIIAFREYGFRVAGLYLVKNILKGSFGKDWHENSNFAEIILQPSKIYSPAVLDILGRFNQQPKITIYGVAHIAEGGIPFSLGRLLKSTGFGADLNDLFEVPEIMLKLQELGSVSDETAYNKWNMGQGMLLITDQPSALIELAKINNVEAKIVGKINKKAKINLLSKGYQKKKLSFSF